MSDKKSFREYESVKAFVRIRPVDKPENDHDPGAITLHVDGINKVRNSLSGEGFQYEKVFGTDARNKDLFAAIIEKSWQCVTKGVNLCVFTYGQTSSGKTHTMKGNDNDPGLVVQTLEGLFSKLGNQYKCCFEVTMSYFEIYNENIYDLLDNDAEGRSLEIREDSHRNPFVDKLTEKPIECFEAAKLLFEVGEAKRRYAITTMNHNSSRSHVILQLKIKTRFFASSHKTYYSTLMMADLAGSENIAKAKTTGQEQREGSNINKSLLSLSNIIMKLKSKDGIPSFRESKLTRILQPVLKENTVTIVICTVNPSRSHLHESISTLRFGTCAGGIRVEIRQKIEDRLTPAKKDTCFDGSLLSNELRQTREDLFQAKLALAETTSLMEIGKRDNEELREKLGIYQRDIEMRNEQISKFQNDIKVLNGIIDAQERSIMLKLETEYQKIIKEIKDCHKIQVESLKAMIVDLMDTGANASKDRKLKKMYQETTQNLTEKERDLSMSRNTIYKLQEDNRRLRRDLEELQEMNNFRARKVPMMASPSITKSALKFSARKEDRSDKSPRVMMMNLPKFPRPFPPFLGSSVIIETDDKDESRDQIPSISFRSCITKLNTNG